MFGLWEARALLAGGATSVLVEGPFDAMAVTSAGGGRFAGVAPCGTALTASQAAALSHAADLSQRGVLVGFDNDQAGRRAAARAYHLLSPHTSRIAAAALPDGCDPAGLFTARGPAALAAALSRARPLADLVVDAEIERWSRWLDHAEGRLNALQAVAPVVAAMRTEHIARQVVRLARRLGIDHAAVTGAVADAVPRALACRSAHAACRDLPGRPPLEAAQACGGAAPSGRPASRADRVPLRTRGVAG
jgi:DNA primase